MMNIFKDNSIIRAFMMIYLLNFILITRQFIKLYLIMIYLYCEFYDYDSTIYLQST